MQQNYKNIEKIFKTKEQAEGVGARVHRSIGTSELKRLDPFLMLDFAKAKLPAGFPDHPHRGFEAVSYTLSGKWYHEDSKGHSGEIGAGDLQWMTASKGIVHAEMPASFEEESVGFQLWINLAKKNKFCEPEYQEISKKTIPLAKKEGVTVKVVAGESLGVKGPIHVRTPVYYLDVKMEPNSKFEQKIPKGWNSLAYMFEGEGYFGPRKAKATTNSAVVLVKDDNEILTVETQENGGRFLLLAGQPINEPVVQYGPFVLSSHEELEQAFEDYQLEQNGFEGAQTWESEIQYLNLAKPNKL